MPKYICSFERDGTRYYFDFSTVVDAPTTHAMTVDEYKRYYRSRFGSEGMRELVHRLARAEEKGTSAIGDKSLQDTAWVNAAGPKGGSLTVKKLLDLVLSERPDRKGR